ncbi:hypothetical protein BC831DRAFT_424724 [Entophlyctis helioformis]|nr:hypothetical protein BC831DRAFT_424724 [Entophlyctis helioformis]
MGDSLPASAETGEDIALAKQGKKGKNGAASASTPPAKARKPPQAGGAFIRNIMKKGGRNGGPLRIEDLDEDVLKKRLEKLDEELNDYKTKCAKYKKENDWYREEIETCQRDTTEYIAYLESKKSEKLEAINLLTESNKKDMEMFLVKRKKREEENHAKVAHLKDSIIELEMKLSAKESEIMQLSDTMARRAKHEAEMAKIRKEMQAAQFEHDSKMAEQERSLLETRMKLQKEAEAKIKSMESAAHEKAAKYLADHTAALEAENRRLERELRRVTLITQQQIERKERLEQESRELEREQRLRQDLVRMRLKKIHEAQERQTHTKERQRHFMAAENKRVVAKALESKGLLTLGLSSSHDGWWVVALVVVRVTAVEGKAERKKGSMDASQNGAKTTSGGLSGRGGIFGGIGGAITSGSSGLTGFNAAASGHGAMMRSGNTGLAGHIPAGGNLMQVRCSEVVHACC